MNAEPATQEKFGVFISYSFEIESLARKIKDKLQVLDDDNRLDIFLASELGGRKYRDEIDRRLKSDQVLLLPFPHRTMRLEWVCFELGGFRRGGTPICIMNTNLDKPPEQLADWNAFKADTGDLKRFFDMLFIQGAFTNGVPINPKINDSQDFRTRLKEAIAEIETEFAAFRIDERFFTSRIEIASPPTLSRTGARIPSKLKFDTAEVSGSERALAMFDLQNGASWSTLKDTCSEHSSVTWLTEIEGVLRLARDKLLARTLTPFRIKQRGAFIPVITRIESIDGVPSKLNVIFVEVHEDTRIGPDVFGNYDAMPTKWKELFVLLDIGRRFRWDAINSVRSNLHHRLREAPEAQWVPEAQRVLSCSKDLQKEMMGIGFSGEAQFFGPFDTKIRASLKKSIAPYVEAEKAFAKAIEERDLVRALEELDRISLVNKSFLEHTARQIHKLVRELS